MAEPYFLREGKSGSAIRVEKMDRFITELDQVSYVIVPIVLNNC
jgi:hypothetical protein